MDADFYSFHLFLPGPESISFEMRKTIEHQLTNTVKIYYTIIYICNYYYSILFLLWQADISEDS